ncbi:MAG: DUF5998 family protein [Scrofimicrobium sp.]
MTSFDKVRSSGFHTDLLEKTVRDLGGGKLPEHSLYNLETSFDDDSVFRHLDYVGLLERRMIAVHIDELASGMRWMATVIPLSDVGPIEIAQVLLSDEETGGPADGSGNELMVNIGFGSAMTLDLDKVQCEDPECEYDHGYSGFLKRDGLAMRFEDNPDVGISSASDDAMAFVRALMSWMDE